MSTINGTILFAPPTISATIVDIPSTLTAEVGKAFKGQSAYDIWIAQGNDGTEQDFLDSLNGGVIIQDTQPTVTQPTLWIQTENGNPMSIWIVTEGT